MINSLSYFFNTFSLTIKKYYLIFSAALALCASVNAHATIVQFQTNMGNFEVNLYDVTNPKTVANFLAYVKADAYKSAIFHRAETSFVVQGGGFTFAGSFPWPAIKQNASVVNEPIFSNRRGTIAMAKLPAQPDSATNQWFFNLSDNSYYLDNSNGGYTVFGQVVGSGMSVVDAIAALNIIKTQPVDQYSAFNQVPMNKYTQADLVASKPIMRDNLVIIQNIIVLDANTNTAANLNPVKITPSNNASGGGSSGGGNIGILGLFMLIMGSVFLAKRNNAI